MADRRIVEEQPRPGRPGRSRGPVIGLLIVMSLVLVVLVLFLVSGDTDDGDDDVQIEDIEVDIGGDDG